MSSDIIKMPLANTSLLRW